MAGRREIAGIARFAPTLTQPLRRRLNLPLKQGPKRFPQVPAYDVFYQGLTRMGSEAFAPRRTDWLQPHHGQLPAARALDGKMIRAHIGLRTLAQHEDGVPQAVAGYDQQENTPRGEQTAAAALLAKLPALDGKIVTADPWHCQRETARVIGEKGGAYLFQIKGNPPKLLAQAQALDVLPGTPFLPRPPRATAGAKNVPSTPLNWKR